jgi:D-beta-D-heptose 7-phosphate kinase/D-beta-D-heptose 1-phosphate adenosyltransferase
MSTDLINLVHRLGRPRVLVVGDLMLDRYVWGDAARISQEAPVILLHADRREERLGGASSVATMLQALGAEVVLTGVLGADGDAARVRQILSDLTIDADAVLADPARPTTVKERYIGRAQHKHPQQMLRVDYETRAPLTDAIERKLIDRITAAIRGADVVLVSDYDKGVCTPAVLAATIAAAKSRGLRVLADPTRGGDYSKYRGCATITPNRLEAGLAVGRQLNLPADALAAAGELCARLDLEVGIVTLDKDGMALVGRDGTRGVYPTRPRQVYDITGAGDMVLSVLGLAVAAGASFADAIRLANVAGGLEVEKVGVATVTRDEILRDVGASDGPVAKFMPLSDLLDSLELRRRSGQRVAFTNGCFDVLHVGHVQYLQEARAQADLLVVGLNSDASVRSLKGPDRPVNPLDARAVVLAGLQAVDYVTPFDEATPIELIKAIRPDVHVKGADYAKGHVVGADFVESYGGRVHLAELRDGYSTTGLLQRLRAA